MLYSCVKFLLKLSEMIIDGMRDQTLALSSHYCALIDVNGTVVWIQYFNFVVFSSLPRLENTGHINEAAL